MGGIEFLGNGLAAISQRRGERGDLCVLLRAEGEPLGDRRIEVLLGAQGVGNVERGARRGHRELPRAAEYRGQRTHRRIEIGAPHVAAVDDSGDDEAVMEGGRGVDRVDGAVNEVHGEAIDVRVAEGADRAVGAAEVGGDQDRGAVGLRGQRAVDLLGLVELGIGEVGDEARLVDLHPLCAA